MPRRLLACLLACLFTTTAVVTTAPAASALPIVAPASASDIVHDSNLTQVRDLLNGINAYRASKGLRPVKYSPTVSVMSQEWSNRIAANETPYTHRPNFWTDPRVGGPVTNVHEIIAVAWSRNASALIAWWKTSPAHNAALIDPNVNVIGVGVTFTNGNYVTTPTRYTMWGVVNLFHYNPVPSNATSTVTSTPSSGPAPTAAPAGICPAGVAGHATTTPPAAASIRSTADVLAVDTAGVLWDYPATGGGSLASRRSLMTGFGGAQDAFAADWNQDGVVDVVTIWRSGLLTLNRGLAGGGFGGAVQIGNGWAGMTATVGLWCSGDRFPAIVAHRPDGTMLYYRNATGTGASNGIKIGAGWQGLKFSMADVDGNGSADLAVRRGDGSMLLYRSDGRGHFLSEARRTIGSGWGPVVSTRTLYGYTGAGSKGLVAKWTDGRLSYYPIASGGLRAGSAEGHGWTSYALVK
ncbi:CAP domain-containing protein [Tersicoccus sp. MR15.9]|uniref:CAP domain-containing protein n=1 Tax=Tersicoccus mangrovi TaxID=3121635 RepID=UPI002FE55D0F